MSKEGDANSHLFGEDEQMTEDEQAMHIVYGLNPDRVRAMRDVWYDAMIKHIETQGVEGEEKNDMIFALTAQSVLDMIGDSVDPSLAPGIMSSLDLFLGVALTNKKFGVNLMEEQAKAVQGIPQDKFPTDEAYHSEIVNFMDAWWDIPQPLLNGRNPRDAITEALREYGLNP